MVKVLEENGVEIIVVNLGNLDEKSMLDDVHHLVKEKASAQANDVRILLNFSNAVSSPFFIDAARNLVRGEASINMKVAAYGIVPCAKKLITSLNQHLSTDIKVFNKREDAISFLQG
ncbi:MAG: hypothetical protein JXR63_10355 [Spirochaetales bacterium]|nr:hypothetical protein [Spirochaetales bacterium]